MSCSNFDGCRKGVAPQLILPLKQRACGGDCDGSIPNGYANVKYNYPGFMDCGAKCSEDMVSRYTINKPLSYGSSYGTYPIDDQINFGNRTTSNSECGLGSIGSADLSYSGCFRSYL